METAPPETNAEGLFGAAEEDVDVEVDDNNMESILTGDVPPVAPKPEEVEKPVPATGKKRERENDKPVPKKRKVAVNKEKGLQVISGFFKKK